MFQLRILRTTLTNIIIPVTINEKYGILSIFVLILGMRQVTVTARLSDHASGARVEVKSYAHHFYDDEKTIVCTG